MKSTFSKLMASVFGAIFLLMPLQLSAEDVDSSFVEIAFTAEIDWDENGQYIRECMGVEHVDIEIITGRYTYDALADGIPNSENPDEIMNYFQDTAIYDFQTEINGIAIESVIEPMIDDESAYAITVSNVEEGEGSDGYSILFRHVNTSNTDIEFEAIRFYFSDNTGSILDSYALTEVPPTEIGDWGIETLSIDVFCNDIGGYVIAHNITMERVYPVFDIVDATEILLDADALDAEQERGLYQKIASAMDKIDDGKIPQGCHQLNAFMCQLDALLPMFEPPYDEQAETILDEAYDIFLLNCDVEEYASCAIGYE